MHELECAEQPPCDTMPLKEVRDGHRCEDDRQLGSEDARRVRWTGLHPHDADHCLGLVNSRRLGLEDERILENIVGLTPEALQAVWVYFGENAAEIDEDIRENEMD